MELTHPGYIDYSSPDLKGEDFQQSMRLLDIRSKMVKFEDFLPFINTDGLNEDAASSFLNFLHQLFQRTSHWWTPGSCRSTEMGIRVARTILKTHYQQIFSKVVPKRVGYSHFWAQLETLADSIVLIIDPAGVPVRPIIYDYKQILPYFGPIGSAQGYAESVYTRGKDINNQGYRDLPRGFHP